MKKLLTAFSIAALLVPGLALAYHHHWHRPTPTPTPIPTPTPTPVSGNKGMNIGHDGQVTTQELATLTSMGFNSVRIYYSSWGDPTTKSEVLTAKAAGKYIIMGGWYGTLNASQLNDYDNKVVADCQWAQAHGVDQCSLGNEQETNLGDLSEAQWAAHLDVLYPKVVAVYKGVISYEMNSEHEATYKNVKSPIVFGINTYAGYAYAKSHIQTAISYWGASRVYVSEINCDMQYSNNCPTDSIHAAEVAGDYMQLIKDYPNMKIFYFVFSANGQAAVPSIWGLYSNGKLTQPLTANVLSH